MTNDIKLLRDHMIIQIGDTYNYKGGQYKVLTATSKIMESNNDSILMSEEVFYLKNIDTGVVINIPRKELEVELSKNNKTINLG